jgi:uncharacterized membrane protein
MMLWYGGHGVFWEIVLSWIVMIAFWIFVIWAIYTFAAGRRTSRDDSGSAARRILDERLARGDISPETYGELRELIDSHGTASDQPDQKVRS